MDQSLTVDSSERMVDNTPVRRDDLVIVDTTSIDESPLLSQVERIEIRSDVTGGMGIVSIAEQYPEQIQHLEQVIMAKLTTALGYTPRLRRGTHEEGIQFYLFGDHLSDDDLLAIYDVEWELLQQFPDLNPLIDTFDSYGRQPSEESLWRDLYLVAYHSATTA